MARNGATPGAKALFRKQLDGMERQMAALRKMDNCGSHRAAINRLQKSMSEKRLDLCQPTISVEKFNAAIRQAMDRC